MPRVGEMPTVLGNASRRTVLGGIVGATTVAAVGPAVAAHPATSLAPSPEFLACKDLWAVFDRSSDDDAADAALEEYYAAFDRLAALPPSMGKLFELHRLARVEAKGAVKRDYLCTIEYITHAIYQTLDALAGEAV